MQINFDTVNCFSILNTNSLKILFIYGILLHRTLDESLEMYSILFQYIISHEHLLLHLLKNALKRAFKENVSLIYQYG